ncbi:MAG: hypothetical protein OEY64_08885 [Nitrospinota bacterium]|nr:hypothetical protein [Nitrospinota bacterium]
MKANTFIMALLLLLPIYAFAKDSGSPSVFRHYMVEIFQNYRNVYLSVQEKKYDVTDIHLKQMQEYIARAPGMTPDLRKDGKKLDKKLFMQRLSRLEKTVADMRTALASYDFKAVDRMPMEIFNICVLCHADMKMEQLFRIPKHATLFGEYMHEISKIIDTAELFVENGEHSEAYDYLLISNFYLELLEKVFPAEGKSGIIMDKTSFNSRIMEVKNFNTSLQVDIKANKPVDISKLKDKFNNLCVACHEPDRIL